MATISNGSAAQPSTEEAAFVEALNPEASRNSQRFRKHDKCRIRNLLSTAGIFFALMLIAGAIFFHIQQKSHFGRMNIEIRRKLEHENVAEIELPLEVVSAPTVAALSTDLVTADCLFCIAETTTENKPRMCGKSPCGIYSIYRPYWQDALRTLKTAEAEDYESCVSSPDCAAAIVRAYMKTYSADCDGDGTIGCRDYIMLHLLGPTGCVTKPLTGTFRTRMDKCLRVRELE